MPFVPILVQIPFEKWGIDFVRPIIALVSKDGQDGHYNIGCHIICDKMG
jgi:hypothetical protein